MVRPMTEQVINVSSIAHGGAGIGRPEVAEGEPAGPTWFVEGALPDEKVLAKATHEAKRFVRGNVVKILEAAPSRVEPPCALASTCGGCSWQHVAVADQATLKQRIVADQLRGVVQPSDVVMHTDDAPALGYRRRARMHYERDEDGTVRLGFFATASRTLVDVPQCAVLVPVLDKALARLRDHGALLNPRGEVHALTDGTDVVLALPGIKPESAQVKLAKAALGDGLVGILLRGGRQTHSVGRTRLEIADVPGVAPVTANALAFAQANAARNAALVRHVTLSARAEGARVLELFCGAGNFTRALAKVARRVWALDEDREMIGSLRTLAEEHHLPINAKRGAVGSLLASMAKNDTTYDVVVLDPSRRGLGQTESANLAEVATSRIVYVSCDPATLARDLKVLVEKGWSVDEVTVFDLMPMTPEVETVAVLTRKARKGAAPR